MPATTTPKKTSNTTFNKIKAFINKYDFFYIVGHEAPDGDCIGSELALAGLLTILGKKHVVLSAGPFNDNLSKMYSSHFTTSLSQLSHAPMKKEHAALILLDAATPERMGKIFAELADLPALVIDHHASVGVTFGAVRYIDTTAPANTILIYRLFKYYNIAPNKEIAHYLLLGIITDTQFFRFVKPPNPEPLLIAADLISLGVSPSTIYQQISYGYTYLSRKIIAQVLDRAQRVNNNRITITYISYNDYIHKDDIPQSYEIYQMLESTHKNLVVVYIQEILNNNNMPACKIGMRSKKVDIGSVAKQWGGGGHPNAAGFTIDKPLSEVRDICMSFFDTLVI